MKGLEFEGVESSESFSKREAYGFSDRKC